LSFSLISKDFVKFYRRALKDAERRNLMVNQEDDSRNEEYDDDITPLVRSSHSNIDQNIPKSGAKKILYTFKKVSILKLINLILI
jgi:hypothetical protein